MLCRLAEAKRLGDSAALKDFLTTILDRVELFPGGGVLAAVLPDPTDPTSQWE
jgi:hypothetical protein